MSKLSEIKQRATEIAQKRNQVRDQEQARIERARMEARKEAKRERTQQRAQQAREQERERVLNDEDSGGIFASIAETVNSAADAVDDGDDQRLDDIQRAMGTDFDGDGETLADEFGLQSAARADAEDNAIDGLGRQVDRNTSRIGSLEDMGIEEPGRRARGDQRDTGPMGGSGGGLGGGMPEPIDPEDFGFGGGDDDGGFFGGGGL